MLEHDQQYMRQCITLARNGAGSVSPNPMVGAVLVNDGNIIGKGYHQRFGEAHAEVNAINNATESVRGATLYVNLEPCCYTGKTPPCTELIISSGIRRVVIGMKDPNPRVSGKGMKKLQQAGIEVTVGVLEDEAKLLNEAFTKYVRTKTPFVALKIAQTLDGKVADNNGKSQWITEKEARRYVHQLRSEYDAVVVGATTIKEDNPALTVRDVVGRNPVRVIIDGNFSVPEDAKVFNDSAASTLLFISGKRSRKQIEKKLKLEKKKIEIIEMPDPVPGYMSLEAILHELGERGIASVLVEGGATLFSYFLEQKQADKLYVFIAPKILGQGLDVFAQMSSKLLGSDEIKVKDISFRQLQNDLLIEGYL